MTKRCKTCGITTTVPALSLLLASVGLGISSIAAMAANVPLTGNCHVLDNASLAMVKSLAWNHERAIVARHGVELPARAAGLREHGRGFKLSLFYQDSITGPSEAIVFSMNLGNGVEYRIGSVSYSVLADGTRLLSSMSSFEDAACEVK